MDRNTMSTWVKCTPSKLFMKIAEPRAIRIIQFAIYITMMASGVFNLWYPPSKFEMVLGQQILTIFTIFLFLGGLLGSVAVLPGIWWLERVGLIALFTGMLIYAVAIISLGSSPIGVVNSIVFALTFVQRWTEIRKFQLAPREK